MTNNKNNSTSLEWKISLSIIILIFTSLALMVLSKEFKWGKDERGDTLIEDTPVVIESIMPKGDLYVCSAIIEDYINLHKTESRLGLFKKEHSCVQIVRQLCSYKIDLGKVSYEHGEDNIIYVRIPNLEYIATTQDQPFMSDDEEYWIKEMPNTNELKNKVEAKIKNRFETKENKNSATRYAEEAISNMLERFGYKAEFISTLERRTE